MFETQHSVYDQPFYNVLAKMRSKPVIVCAKRKMSRAKCVLETLIVLCSHSCLVQGSQHMIMRNDEMSGGGAVNGSTGILSAHLEDVWPIFQRVFFTQLVPKGRTG